MNYQEHYDRLISRAKERKLDCYTESHHITPRCMGGADDKNNLVDLTAREHFIAHLLLMKIYPKSYGLVRALHMMCISSKNQERSMNRMYGWLKEKFSISQKENQKGEKNSQFDKVWISHVGLKVSFSVHKDNLYEYILDGFIKKRIINFSKFDKIVDYKISNENRRLESIRVYSDYYKIYSELGFKKFVETTGYKHSQANLVMRFKKLVPEFLPQNGKQRGY